MELQLTDHAAGRRGVEGLVERCCGVPRELVHHNAKALRLGIVDVHQVAHVVGEVCSGTSVGDFHVPPWAMHIDEHEDVDGPISYIFVVEARGLARHYFHGDTGLTYELSCCLVEADDGPCWTRGFRVQLQHVLHPGDELSVDLRDAPMTCPDYSDHELLEKLPSLIRPGFLDTPPPLRTGLEVPLPEVLLRRQLPSEECGRTRL